MRMMTGVACAAIAVAPAAVMAQGALTQQIVRQLVEQQRGGASASQRFQWHSIQIAPPRRLTGGEASLEGINNNTLAYPVRVDYTVTTGAGPAAYVRDVTAFYFVYKDDFGKWAAGQYAHQGTRNDLRGG